MRLRGRQVGRMTPSVRDHEKAPAFHSLAQTGGGPRNEDQRTDNEPGANGQRRGRFWPPFEARSGAQQKGPRGRRKALIRLDPAKEIQGYSLLLIWAGFAGRGLDLAQFGVWLGGIGI